MKDVEKTIYFVRHGESVDNARNVYSSSDTALTETGEGEAESIQSRCLPLGIDVVLASDYRRAKQTAAKIAGNGTELETSELLREITHPSELVGLEHDDPQAKKIRADIRSHQSDPSYHYSDEENIFEFRDRLISALDMLEKRPEQTIFVVSHSFVLQAIMAIILIGEKATPQAIAEFARRLVVTNTGITIVNIMKDKSWSIAAWNNITHLN